MVHLFSIVSVLLLSLLLNSLDYSYTENDVIRKYQLNKINNNSFKDVSTIILGDSSSGNVISAQHLYKLSGLKSENLSLTAAWGVEGSLGILKKSLASNKKIKNIVIIQTFDVWSSPLTKESLLELSSILNTLSTINLTDIISYYFNPREIIWFLRSFFGFNNELVEIDMENDYMKQKDGKYSNGEKVLSDDFSLNGRLFSIDKVGEISRLVSFCNDNNLNCILVNGPIHSKLAKQSKKYIQYIIRKLTFFSSEIQYIANISTFSNSKMGDSDDHLDVAYKKLATKKYYALIKPYLEW